MEMCARTESRRDASTCSEILMKVSSEQVHGVAPAEQYTKVWCRKRQHSWRGVCILGPPLQWGDVIDPKNDSGESVKVLLFWASWHWVWRGVVLRGRGIFPCNIFSLSFFFFFVAGVCTERWIWTNARMYAIYHPVAGARGMSRRAPVLSIRDSLQEDMECTSFIPSVFGSICWAYWTELLGLIMSSFAAA